ncbi:MAG TPA: hypothetical protein VNM47_08080 [Terriglobia bacterium]|nr:hypothetical protein [Terriglobia bacterium]
MKKRLRISNRARLAQFQAPPLMLELQPGFVAGARLDANSRVVLRVRVEEIEVGALVPSPNKPNVPNPAALQRTIEQVVSLVGNGGDKLGLLIPDLSARVALLEFDALPDNPRDAETLVHWRMGEVLPFNLEEAHICYQVLSRRPGSVDVLAMALQGSIRAEYEAVVEGLNRRPVLVLPASVALLPLLPEDSPGQLLLHLCPGSLTAIVVALNRVRYWRTLTLETESSASTEEVGREVTRVLAACQDHLKLPVQDIWFCARPPGAAGIKDALAEILGRELRSLPATVTTPETMPAEEAKNWQYFGTPFNGIVANLESRQ